MTTPTDTAKLADEIEALAKDATQAPWAIETESKSRGTYLVRRLSENTFIPAAQTLSLQESENAALIVALVNSAPTIIAALRELEAVKAENAKLREALEPFAARTRASSLSEETMIRRACAALGGAG